MSTILNKPNEFEHKSIFLFPSPQHFPRHFSKYIPFPLFQIHPLPPFPLPRSFSCLFFYCRPLNQTIRFSSQITCTERLWMLAAHNSTNAAFFACESNPLPCERSIERKKEK